MAPAAARPAATKPKTQSDVLAELEKIRRQHVKPGGAPTGAPSAPVSLASPSAARQPLSAPTQTAVATPTAPAHAPHAHHAASPNGKHEINREIQLTLKKGDFERAKRFLLTLHVEDGQHQVMEAVRDFQVDIGNMPQHQKVVLHLNIALRTKE
jgi:hypothetical protein